MSTQVRAKEDELLTEFRALIDQVGTAVAHKSVLPAVQKLIDDWTAQTKKLEAQFEKNLRTLGEASRSIANTLETHGSQLRSSMTADTKRWETTLGQQSEALAKGLTGANNEVSALSRSLEELATRLAGAWETAATSFDNSCARVLSDTDVPAQLAVLNEYTETSQAVTDHLRQATDTAMKALERWQAEVSGQLRTVESRLPSLTKEISTLNASLTGWQRTADQVSKSNVETARAVGEYCALTRKGVELIEVMAKTLSQQMLEVQGQLKGLATDTQHMAQRASEERQASAAAMQRSTAELKRDIEDNAQLLDQSMQKYAQVLLTAHKNTASTLESLLETHDQRLHEAQAATAQLMQEAQNEMWQRTRRALGWLATLVVATGGVLAWLLLR